MKVLTIRTVRFWNGQMRAGIANVPAELAAMKPALFKSYKGRGVQIDLASTEKNAKNEAGYNRLRRILKVARENGYEIQNETDDHPVNHCTLDEVLASE